jgi:hypothetical protein
MPKPHKKRGDTPLTRLQRTTQKDDLLKPKNRLKIELNRKKSCKKAFVWTKEYIPSGPNSYNFGATDFDYTTGSKHQKPAIVCTIPVGIVRTIIQPDPKKAQLFGLFLQLLSGKRTRF